ncbi:MAG TPA: tetraacyldisaccharide 4'-kinase, partial [Verrucomicrobiae bacterium]|nr:tetraacyldisaccharide 4'-kinase [Verrucomicrobiae bacterium]
RRWMYRRGLLRRRRLPRAVVSIGNLTAGGTGKTPFAALVAEHYLRRGLKVALLSRGYGGGGDGSPRIVSDGRTVFLSADEGGDEPVLLAQSVPGLLVATGRDRYAAGMFLLERLQADLFILDDGFQHMQLARDLDILLLDARRPFGNGLTLPAGLLREPRGGAAFADLLVLTRCGEHVPTLPCTQAQLRSRHRLQGAVCLQTGEARGLGDFAGNGFVFAGIAEPGAFFADVEREGVRVAGRMPLPDHAVYDGEVVDRLLEAAERSGADYFLTTEKDAVKIAPFLPRLAPLYAARLRLEVEEPERLERLLDGVLR